MLNITKQLKDYFWPKFSIMVRKEGTDENGVGFCFSCGKEIHWRNGDAGHWLAGRGNYILFHPYAVHLQCKPCNGGFMNSAPKNVQQRYDGHMVAQYGKKITDEIRQKNRKSYPFTPEIVMHLILAAEQGMTEYTKVFFEVIK
jgi:hypothetical protein